MLYESTGVTSMQDKRHAMPSSQYGIVKLAFTTDGKIFSISRLHGYCYPILDAKLLLQRPWSSHLYEGPPLVQDSTSLS